MNIEKIRIELERLLVNELTSKAEGFSNYEMISLDLGIHPWHAYIEPSFLTTSDRAFAKTIGDWILYNFAASTGPKWPEAQALAVWMRKHYEENPREHSIQLFTAVASALNSPSVQVVLRNYRKTVDFYVSVYNPDDSTNFNFCVQQSSLTDA